VLVRSPCDKALQPSARQQSHAGKGDQEGDDALEGLGRRGEEEQRAERTAGRRECGKPENPGCLASKLGSRAGGGADGVREQRGRVGHVRCERRHAGHKQRGVADERRESGDRAAESCADSREREQDDRGRVQR
jgi:hypothetical protein